MRLPHTLPAGFHTRSAHARACNPPALLPLDARPQVRKEDDGRLVQRNVKSGTERELRVARLDSLSKAGALQLRRIGVPLTPGLHTAAGNPRLQLLVTGEGACSSSSRFCRPSPLHLYLSWVWVCAAYKPPPPQTKEDAVLHIAHAAIFDANAVVYGGFVRDYIMRNESANDVDVNTADYDATEKQITAALKSLHIIEQDPHVKQWGKQNLYRRLTYDWKGHKLEVDLVDPAKVPRAPRAPSVDQPCSSDQPLRRRGSEAERGSGVLTVCCSLHVSSPFVSYCALGCRPSRRSHSRRRESTATWATSPLTRDAA